MVFKIKGCNMKVCTRELTEFGRAYSFYTQSLLARDLLLFYISLLDLTLSVPSTHHPSLSHMTLAALYMSAADRT